MDAGDARAAIRVCEEELSRTHDDWTKVRLANELRRDHQYEPAERLATEALTSRASADAYQVLGKIAALHDLDRGLALLSTARDAHLALFRHAAAASDMQAIAGIYNRKGDSTSELLQLDECLEEAELGQEPLIGTYCQISAGDALDDLGYADAAAFALEKAEQLPIDDEERAHIAAQRGVLYQHVSYLPTHANENWRAVDEFERARKLATSAHDTALVLSIDENLVYSYARIHSFELANARLEEAAKLDTQNYYADDRVELAALIAEQSGDPARAHALDLEVYDRLNDENLKIQVSVREARIALAAGEFDTATEWAQKGVALVEKVRAQPAVEVRPWILSRYRAPYEVLFVTRVRQHRFPDALDAFDHWQGRAFLDATAGSRRAVIDYRDAVAETVTRRGTIKRLTPSSVETPPDAAALLAGLRGVELVALPVAENEVWRVTVDHGVLDIVELGPFSALQHDLETFERDPTKTPEIATQLGERLLGARAFTHTDDPLYVIFDDPLESLPAAALRRDGHFLAELRAIIHPPRLTEVGCARAADPSVPATIIAGNLRGARGEALRLAARLRTRAILDGAATRAALLATPANGILHVGAHANRLHDGAALTLADGDVYASDIAAESHGPAFVFLAACASGRAADLDFDTSLAAAYLVSGTHAVVATLQPVDDDAAAMVTSAFYRNNGATDWARALSNAQVELAATGNPDWPQFAVFGHDICKKDAP